MITAGTKRSRSHPQDPGSPHRACSGGLKADIPSTSRIRVVSHLWTMAIVRPLRFLGVLLVLYAKVGWYIFPAAEVPADAVRVPLWLFFSGVCALIVDEVGERITREAREVMDRKEWFVLAWSALAQCDLNAARTSVNESPRAASVGSFVNRSGDAPTATRSAKP